ncbi:MAG: serine hydrolase domain-containing protein [Thermomicrobiales bacterium]
MRTSPPRPASSRFGMGDDAALAPLAWPLEPPDYASLEAAVQGEASRWNVPGVGVAVLHDGEVIATATGIRSVTTKMPFTTDTISQIGSISKVFTTTLVMTLVDEGKLDLDEPVTTYVPDLRLGDQHARAALTLRHLLSHSGGFEGDRFLDYGRGDDAYERSMVEMDTLPQWFQPGELFSYCNVGFYLIPLIIQRVTGEVPEDLMRTRIFEPLGMETVTFYAEDAITRDHAVGHNLGDRLNGPTIARPFIIGGRHVNLCGNIIASPSELLKFAQPHIGRGEYEGTRIISEASADLMQTPHIAAGPPNRSFGQGWSMYEWPDLKVIEHTGGTIGFRAFLSVVPERDYAIAIVTNSDTGANAMQTIEAWALKHYLGAERPVPQPAGRSAADLDAVTGTFTRHDGRFVITREDDALRVTSTAVDERTGEESEGQGFRLIPVEPVDGQVFRIPDGPMLGSIVDFVHLPTREAPETDRLLMRLGGRLAAREGAAPVKTSGRTATRKPAAKRNPGRKRAG